jgi:hypothetical protein
MLRLLAVVTLTVAFGYPFCSVCFAETAAQKRVKVTPVLPKKPAVEPKEKPKDFRLKVSGPSKSSN